MSVGMGFGFYKYTELEWNEKINNSYLIKSPSEDQTLTQGLYVLIITFISIRIISVVALTGLTLDQSCFNETYAQTMEQIITELKKVVRVRGEWNN